MGTKTAEEQEFYIKETSGPLKKVYNFVKVPGEIVDIGKEIRAFASNGSDPDKPLEFWRITDLITGERVSDIFGTKEEAIADARERAAKETIEDIRRWQRMAIDDHNISPAVKDEVIDLLDEEIEIIQEPREPEIKTCVPE